MHISEISNRRIQHPSAVLKPDMVVQVTILSVDEGKRKVSLTMRSAADREKDNQKKDADAMRVDDPSVRNCWPNLAQTESCAAEYDPSIADFLRKSPLFRSLADQKANTVSCHLLMAEPEEVLSHDFEPAAVSCHHFCWWNRTNWDLYPISL